MRKQTNVLFYVLSIYVILQFTWWGYHLIQLSSELDGDQTRINRRIWMIVGEGSVFILILIAGILRIRHAILKEVALSQRQTNFLLSITHELKTPIASIKLFLQTLNKRQLNDEKRIQITEKALEENTRLERMIENILQAGRIESKLLRPIRSSFILNDMLDKIADRYRNTNQQIFIDIKQEIEIMADPFIMEAILQNLVDNAQKYGGSGTIEIYAVTSSTNLHIGVKDLGPGIPEKELPFIYDKFYRVGNEEIRTEKGSGLGLFIVQEFALLLKGKITYLRNTPKGSIFELTLPL